MYDQVFPQAEPHDTVLFGTPRVVRSDEWLRWTSYVISQAENGYPEVNPDIRNGVDIAVLTDLPHGGWLAWFEPRNFAFHVFRNVEFAFAFKWWFLFSVTFVATSHFAQRVVGVARTKALLLASFVVLTPLLHWWWQSQAFLAIAYVLIGLSIVDAIEKSESGRHRLFFGLLLGYFGLCLAFLQYPPFLIAVLLPGLAFYAGSVGNATRFTVAELRSYLRRTLPSFLLALSIVGVGMVLYLDAKQDVIETVTSSEFPGDRSFESGEGTSAYVYHLLSSNLAPFFQSDATSARYWLNQSEASNFILILPFISLAPMAYASYVRRRTHIDFVVVGNLAVFVLGLLWMLVPGVTSVLAVTQLHRVPIARLNMLFGFTQVLLLAHLLRPDDELTLDEHRRLKHSAVVIGLIAFAVTVFANTQNNALTQGILKNQIAALVFAVLLAGGTMLVIMRKQALGMAALVTLSLGSVFYINPLQQGLDPILDSPIVEAIRNTSDPDDRLWAVSGYAGAPNFADSWSAGGFVEAENFALQAGKRSLSGSVPYTQPEFWSQLSNQAEAETISDRGGLFALNLTSGPTYLELVQENFVWIILNPCGEFAREVDLGFVVTIHPVDFPCLVQIEKVQYRDYGFSIYKVK